MIIKITCTKRSNKMSVIKTVTQYSYTVQLQLHCTGTVLQVPFTGTGSL